MLIKYWWVFLIAAPLLAVLLAGARVYHAIAIWEYDGPDVVFEIKPGEPFSSINGRLYRQKIITSAKVFYRYSKYNKIMTSFKAGKFMIKSDSSMLDVIQELTEGNPITSKVTIPEGKNLYEIAEIMENNKITEAKSFIMAAKDADLASELNIPFETLEGYLYPDTYQLTPGMSGEDVVKAMVKVFNQKTKGLDFSQNPLGLTKSECVVLASVVEKETGAGFERPIIAGVFFNRLKKRMRLQSDPTTIYGIWENFDGNLKKRHLQEKTPYNTYRIGGLPKGPISNPGLASLKAVLNPQEHSYLYFVSQNDGTHVFSKTYKEHNAAVDRFQRNYRARQGKSWRNLKSNQATQ